MLDQLYRPRQKRRLLPAGRPGRRFRDRYYHRSGRARGWGPRVIRILLAAVAFAVGVVLVFIPGPAVVFFALAAVLLATDWLAAARALDWAEPRVRRAWRGARRLWRARSPVTRVLLLATGAGVAGATTFGFYRLMH